MAIAGIRLELDASDIASLRRQIRNVFDKEGNANVLRSAIEKALEPALARLKSLTPVGPTGNLERAAAVKVVAYPNSGNAVGLLGYQRAGRGKSRASAGGAVRSGPDRAFHQFWIEDGTDERVIQTISNKPFTRKSHRRQYKSGTTIMVSSHVVKKGQGAVIASSYGRLGPFAIAPTQRKDENQRVQTNPGYPRAFFKKAKKGEVVRIDPMPAGGRAGIKPLSTAWEQTSATVAEILQRELAISIEKALDSLVFSSSGVIN